MIINNNQGAEKVMPIAGRMGIRINTLTIKNSGLE